MNLSFNLLIYYFIWHVLIFFETNAIYDDNTFTNISSILTTKDSHNHSINNDNNSNHTIVYKNHTYQHYVKVFHFMIEHWGESRKGLQSCGNIACDWIYADHIKILKDNLHHNTNMLMWNSLDPITLSLYNIHSWWERTRSIYPGILILLYILISNISRDIYNT